MVMYRIFIADQHIEVPCKSFMQANWEFDHCRANGLVYMQRKFPVLGWIGLRMKEERQ